MCALSKRRIETPMAKRRGQPRTDLAANMKRLRLMRKPKITQEELADASGVSHINLIEAGHRRNIREDTVADLARGFTKLLGFEVQPADLRGRPPGDAPPPELLESTFQDFLKTGVKMDADEAKELRSKTEFRWGNPSVEAWYAALMFMRATRAPSDGGKK